MVLIFLSLSFPHKPWRSSWRLSQHPLQTNGHVVAAKSGNFRKQNQKGRAFWSITTPWEPEALFPQ